MKAKNIFITLGLSCMALAGLGAAGLMSNAKAEQVKADDPDDKMITVIIDMGEAVGYDGFNSPEVHYFDSVSDSIDKYQMLHQVHDTVYAGNLTYRSADQTIDRLEFLFKQNSEDKWSNHLDVTPTESNACMFSYHNTWTQDSGDGDRYEWELTKDTTWTGIRFQYYGDGVNNLQNIYLTPDVASKTYKTTFTIVETDFDAEDNGQIFFGYWNHAALRQSSIDAYTGSASLNSFTLKEPGTYDLILQDSYADGGVFEIKKHISEYVGVYLVGVDADVHVYTFGEGGIEEFGAFPGTKLGDIAVAQEVTGDLKFQGNDLKLWYLPLNYGYPNADHIILSYVNEYGYVGTQTKNMLLVEGSAYWFSYEEEYHNDDAGLALNFLLEAEEKRLAATNDSVCNISKSDAEDIVDAYKKLSSTVRETYIDTTTVNTLRRDGEEGKEYVSYRLVVEELAKIAEVSLGGTNRINTAKVNTATIIVVVSVMVIASASLVAVLVIKKRKHE